MNKKDYVTSYYEKHNYDKNAYNTKKAESEIFLHNIRDLEVKKNGKVLDVGCGVGIIGASFGEKYSTTVYGIDLSSSAVKIARKYGVKSKLTDIDSKWPYPDNYFEVVIGFQIIEHVYNPDHFVNEAKRVLKRGGFLIVTTPNLAAWFNRIIFLFGYQPFFTEVSTVDKTIGLDFTRKLTPNRETVGHVRVFTLRALKEILEVYGFKKAFVKGSSINYLPKFMLTIDRIISLIPSLASDLVVVYRK